MAIPLPSPRNPDPRQTRLAALAVISAMLRRDADTAMVVIRDNDPDVLIPELALLAGKAILTANGYDVGKTLAQVEQWQREVA